MSDSYKFKLHKMIRRETLMGISTGMALGATAAFVFRPGTFKPQYLLFYVPVLIMPFLEETQEENN